jgi:ParB-like chromosome segregation protein Spo0J
MTQTSETATNGGGGVTTVPLDRIVTDVSAWPRQELDRRRVADFAELYRDDDGSGVLPPLDVVPEPDSGGFVLADGWHRFHALHQVEASEAQVRIIPPDDGEHPRRAAYRHGLSLAATAGLPLTRTERVAAVQRLLAERPEWSDRQIGRTCGVSPTTVGKYRNGKASNLDTSPETEPDDDEPSQRYEPEETASQAARTLVRGLVRLDERRGLIARFSEKRAARDMAAALAEALADEYDDLDDAARHARTWSEWLADAVPALQAYE